MSSKPKTKRDFTTLNADITTEVVQRLDRVGKHGAVIAEAPPGAGKSTLTGSVAKALVDREPKLRLAIVTQTNEQADDIVGNIAQRYAGLPIARLTSGDGPSHAVQKLLGPSVTTGSKGDDPDVHAARVVVSTARKWQYERSRLQSKGITAFPIALIDEAYQMRSDMLLGIADLFDTLFCVGDPGQLDPFSIVDDSLWKGLPYSPTRAALATLRLFHQDLEPLLLPISWRLPPSAAGIVSSAFYPFTGFDAGTVAEERSLELGVAKPWCGSGPAPTDLALEKAASEGWAYVELPERFTLRTDVELAATLASLVERLLVRGATVIDELHPGGKELTPGRIAVITAHNDQVHAVRYELAKRKVDPDGVIVSTANKIQGREYDVVFVWHPLAGRRDATTVHLEAGRMCVMLSRHRQACIVVGRAGATQLLEEFPDSDPVFLGEPEKFPDGWQANHEVLQHLARFRVG